MTYEDYVESNDVLFKGMSMPNRIKAFSLHDDEGRYIVFYNENLGILQNRQSAAHELEHIIRGDNEDTDFIEYA